LFSRYAAAAAEEKRTVLSGKDAWRLYDTYGFPVDLTQIMAEERGLTINEADFEKARLESLEASKAGGKAAASGGVKLDVHDLGALEANSAVPKTNDSFKYGEFQTALEPQAINRQNSTMSRPTLRACTTLESSTSQRRICPPTLPSASYLTRPTFTPSKVDRRTILVSSPLTARPSSR